MKARTKGPNFKERLVARQLEAAALKVALDALTPDPPTGG
jgi:hypothetical protein